MDTNPSPRPDDLSDLERRLAGWRPATAGLDPDALLFAAGRASVPRPSPIRFAWPAVAAALALLAAGLGAWIAVERSGRLALAEELRHAPRPQEPAPRELPPAPVDDSDPPPISSYFVARNLVLAHGVDAWSDRTLAPAPAPGHSDTPPILQVGRPDTWPD
jgi:hypothetical protein